MKIVFLLEEPSAQTFLEALLPRLLPDLNFQCIAHEGKQDLEKRFHIKIKGWNEPDVRFVILRDQDSSDCTKAKDYFVSKCQSMKTKNVLVRIACKTIESWYLGDLHAVEKALAINGLHKQQNKTKFRNPDKLGNPTEVLQRITNKRYQKVSGSREIGKHFHLEENSNASHSYNVFIKGIRSLAANA